MIMCSSSSSSSSRCGILCSSSSSTMCSSTGQPHDVLVPGEAVPQHDIHLLPQAPLLPLALSAPLALLLHTRDSQVCDKAKPVYDTARAVAVDVGGVLPIHLLAMCAVITKAGLAVDPVYHVPAGLRVPDADRHLAAAAVAAARYTASVCCNTSWTCAATQVRHLPQSATSPAAMLCVTPGPSQAQHPLNTHLLQSCHAVQHLSACTALS
jgi:hypothetical protein